MRPAIWLAPLLLFFIAETAFAQYCNPAAVHYIVRNEKGEVIKEAELKAILAQLPQQIDDAHTSVFEISFAPDKRTFYWPESVEWEKGTKLSVLMFSNESTCTLHLGEATLQYHSMKMRLLFKMDITRDQSDRRPVIDSLPFQNGTFELVLSGWTHSRDKLIPATHWKRIKGRIL